MLKEWVTLLMLASLLLAAASIPDLDRPDWVYNRAELRAYQIFAELETMGPRAMVYSRAYLDSWLKEVNGSECFEVPPDVPELEFMKDIREGLEEKGLSGGVVVHFTVLRGREGDESDPSFSGLCREGSILVKADLYSSVSDPMTGVKGERELTVQGCQPTAYFFMRDYLNNLSKKLGQLVKRAVEENLSLEELLELIKLNLTLEVADMPAGFTAYWTVYSFPGLIRVVFRIKDGLAEFYHGGELHKGFYCRRVYELELPESFRGD